MLAKLGNMLLDSSRALAANRSLKGKKPSHPAQKRHRSPDPATHDTEFESEDESPDHDG